MDLTHLARNNVWDNLRGKVWGKVWGKVRGKVRGLTDCTVAGADGESGGEGGVLSDANVGESARDKFRKIGPVASGLGGVKFP